MLRRVPCCWAGQGWRGTSVYSQFMVNVTLEVGEHRCDDRGVLQRLQTYTHFSGSMDEDLRAELR